LDFDSNEPSLEELLKLLEESKPVKDNHPFVLFLKSHKLTPGTKFVKIDYLIKSYRNETKKRISITKALKVIKEYLDYECIRGIPYLKVNKAIKGCVAYRGKQLGKTKKA
jgi:hypothetical protein